MRAWKAAESESEVPGGRGGGGSGGWRGLIWQSGIYVLPYHFSRQSASVRLSSSGQNGPFLCLFFLVSRTLFHSVKKMCPSHIRCSPPPLLSSRLCSRCRSSWQKFWRERKLYVGLVSSTWGFRGVSERPFRKETFSLVPHLRKVRSDGDFGHSRHAKTVTVFSSPRRILVLSWFLQKEAALWKLKSSQLPAVRNEERNESCVTFGLFSVGCLFRFPLPRLAAPFCTPRAPSVASF